jgi:hypothetical protein
MAIDPLKRQSTLISGLQIFANGNHHSEAGSIGCFIRTSGKKAELLDPWPGKIDADVYMVTAGHVAEKADPNGDGLGVIAQPLPEKLDAPTDAEKCGDYVAHLYLSPGYDCALVRVAYGRKTANEIPAAPGHFGNNKLKGLAAPKVGDIVYKYGYVTRYTKGKIVELNYNGGPMYRIQSLDTGPWAAQGDSGSMVVRESDDVVVGINVQVVPNTDAYDESKKVSGSSQGLALDLEDQLRNFCDPGGTIGLA